MTVAPRAFPQPQAVLFDLDGTLIDSVPDITQAVAELMASERLAPFDEDDVRVFVGHGVRKLVERALAARGRPLDADGLTAMTARMMTIYPRHLTDRTVLMPGTLECLDQLQLRGIPMAVVTNKPQLAADIVLRHFGLHERFALVLGDAPMEGRKLRPKPAPDMLLFAAHALGAGAPTTFMVGDSPADVESAKAAAMFSVAVRGGYCAVPIESLQADATIDTLADLGRVVDIWAVAH